MNAHHHCSHHFTRSVGTFHTESRWSQSLLGHLLRQLLQMLAHPPLLEILSRLDLAPIRILQRHLLLPLQTPPRSPTLQSLPLLLPLQIPSRPGQGHLPIPQPLPRLLLLQTPSLLLILQFLPRLLPLQSPSRPGQALPPIPRDPPLLLKIPLRIIQDLPPPLIL